MKTKRNSTAVWTLHTVVYRSTQNFGGLVYIWPSIPELLLSLLSPDTFGADSGVLWRVTCRSLGWKGSYTTSSQKRKTETRSLFRADNSRKAIWERQSRPRTVRSRVGMKFKYGECLSFSVERWLEAKVLGALPAYLVLLLATVKYLESDLDSGDWARSCGAISRCEKRAGKMSLRHHASEKEGGRCSQ